LRLRLITSQGEKGENSNRLFNFDLTNGLLIFKPDKHTKIPIKLLGIGRNRQLDLDWLQTQIGIIPITVQLSRTHCCIIFDDTRVENTQKIKGRTAGIDLNPNYIGFAIRNKSGKLVHTIAYDISKVEGNKQNFELIEITKDIQSQCRHFGVETFGIEKLNMKSKDHNKGRNYNRLVNNKWNRNLFVNQLEKRLKRIGIKVNFVLSEYSSWVGNLSHLDLFDPIASAAEIARRASVQYEKELCIWCPLTPPGYQNLWKEDDSLGVNWRRIIDQIKNAKLRYRVLLDHTKCAVSSFVSNKSRVMAICY
jgi:IS605 OrfB family transposase